MTTIKHILGATQRTTAITRDSADLYGPRLITDDATVLSVRAFPFADIAAVVAGGGLALAGAYLLAGNSAAHGSDAAYVGETGNLGRRMQEHAGDETKAFAGEVFVLTSIEGRIDKDDSVHLQKRLSTLIEEASVAKLIKGANPCKANITPERAATLDRMLADALPLFIDAGCRYLARDPQAVAGAATPLPSPSTAPTAAGEDDDEGGPMEIGVTTVPFDVEEMELAYGDLWARGYEHQDRFVVAAGSEMRKVTNPSANSHTVDRRQDLIDKEAAVPIEGVDDRYRLQRAVAFPSRAIAAKVLAGAHVGSDKWRPLRAAAPVIVAV